MSKDKIQILLEHDENALPVEGYNEDYWVTTHGRVISLKNRQPRALMQNTNSGGYPYVNLYYYGDRQITYLHQLVISTFLGPCPEGMEIRHLDGSRDNAYVENLVYSTPKENQHDRIEHGTDARGIKNGSAKLTEKEVHEIQDKYATRKYTQAQLGDEYGVSQAHIGRIVNRENWSHLAS